MNQLGGGVKSIGAGGELRAVVVSRIALIGARILDSCRVVVKGFRGSIEFVFLRDGRGHRLVHLQGGHRVGKVGERSRILNHVLLSDGDIRTVNRGHKIDKLSERDAKCLGFFEFLFKALETKLFVVGTGARPSVRAILGLGKAAAEDVLAQNTKVHDAAFALLRLLLGTCSAEIESELDGGRLGSVLVATTHGARRRSVGRLVGRHLCMVGRHLCMVGRHLCMVGRHLCRGRRDGDLASGFRSSFRSRLNNGLNINGGHGGRFEGGHLKL
jgi:hypothetical protein